MVDVTDLTIVYGYRDREPQRVRRSLESLKKQTIQGFKVIIVDYGSREEIASEMRTLVNEYEFCEYIYSNSVGLPWNRSRALNPGIRQSRTTYTMTTDVDMIFSGSFIQNIIEQVAEDRVVYCRWHFLPEKFSDWNNTDIYKGKLPMVSKGGFGGCCIVKTEILEQINGFDETYCFWGLEDKDLNIRLKSVGIEEQWANSDDIYIFHQWHPVANSVTPNFMPSGLWGRMVEHMYKLQTQPVRNDSNWGEVLIERDVLNFLDSEKKIKRNDKVEIVDYCPVRGYEESQVTDDVIRKFYELESGHAIAISNAGFPGASSFVSYLFFFINKVLWKAGIKSAVDYRKNELHSVLFGFIQSNIENVKDYFWGRGTESEYLIIVKK